MLHLFDHPSTATSRGTYSIMQPHSSLPTPAKGDTIFFASRSVPAPSQIRSEPPPSPLHLPCLPASCLPWCSPASASRISVKPHECPVSSAYPRSLLYHLKIIKPSSGRGLMLTEGQGIHRYKSHRCANRWCLRPQLIGPSNGQRHGKQKLGLLLLRSTYHKQRHLSKIVSDLDFV